VGHNVQSQAGESLTHTYDVRGGQAPIERIETQVVQAVHDMATTITSERMSTFIRRSTVIDTIQTTNVELTMTDLPLGIARILALTVITSNASRIAHATVSIQSSARGMPIWAWDGTNAPTQRFMGASADSSFGSVAVLQGEPAFDRLPVILASGDQPQSNPDITLAFQTTSFGAGDVDMTLEVLLGFIATASGISGIGNPIPSW